MLNRKEKHLIKDKTALSEIRTGKKELDLDFLITLRLIKLPASH